jgi:simple sugar transport system ATP-binding protein
MVRPFDTEEILKMMFGSRPHKPLRTVQPAGREMLVMQRVSSSGGRCGLVDCSVVIREGEVVGLAGLEGSGQEVFLRVACGLKRPQKGLVQFSGRTINENKYIYFKKLSANFLPAARLEEGLISGLTITEHLALQNERRNFRVDYRKAGEAAARMIALFRIKGLPQTSVEELSGGNQQRLLLSFLPPKPHLLLLENPTRGLDFHSVNWVWGYLQSFSRNGTSIVFSSPELDEIMMVAHRVLVFFSGRIIMDVPATATSVQEIGRAIAGKQQAVS